jgi:hypothetical protein
MHLLLILKLLEFKAKLKNEEEKLTKMHIFHHNNFLISLGAKNIFQSYQSKIH